MLIAKNFQKSAKPMGTHWQTNTATLLNFVLRILNNSAMNIITVDEEVWKHLNERLKAISEYILKLEDTSYDSLWLNNHEVCQYLHISEKTLWRMRTNGQIAFSKMYGQYYYTIGAIKEMLNSNAVQTTDEYVEQLMAKGKSYIEKGRKLKSGNH
ncbi:helix-turn-helix domain-containing protein [Sediminibacterium sp. Gen4]|nr:helix-turn-helix domain-containing protein [Sediminibacterium sp. Gen4]